MEEEEEEAEAVAAVAIGWDFNLSGISRDLPEKSENWLIPPSDLHMRRLKAAHDKEWQFNPSREI